MQNAAGGGISDHPNRGGNRYQAIVSDLVSLIEHMQASMKLIESAIAEEAPFGNREVTPGVIELDDVTPRYVRTNAALETCTAGLRRFARQIRRAPKSTGLGKLCSSIPSDLACDRAAMR